MKMFRNIGALLLIAAIQFGYLAYQDIQQPLPEPVRLGPILPEDFSGQAEFYRTSEVKVAGVREEGEAFWQRSQNAQKIIVSAEHGSNAFSRVVVVRYLLVDGGAPYWTSRKFPITQWPNNFWINSIKPEGNFLLVFPERQLLHSSWLSMSVMTLMVSVIFLALYIVPPRSPKARAA